MHGFACLQSLYLLPLWEIPYLVGVVFSKDVCDQVLIRYTALNKSEDKNAKFADVDQSICKTSDVTEVIQELVDLTLMFISLLIKLELELENPPWFSKVVCLKKPRVKLWIYIFVDEFIF